MATSHSRSYNSSTRRTGYGAVSLTLSASGDGGGGGNEDSSDGTLMASSTADDGGCAVLTYGIVIIGVFLRQCSIRSLSAVTLSSGVSTSDVGSSICSTSIVNASPSQFLGSVSALGNVEHTNSSSSRSDMMLRTSTGSD